VREYFQQKTSKDIEYLVRRLNTLGGRSPMRVFLDGPVGATKSTVVKADNVCRYAFSRTSRLAWVSSNLHSK
jgi:hypothetical protein